MLRRTPIKPKRDRPRRNEGRITHGRIKQKTIRPTREQEHFHMRLRREHKGGPPRPCQCGCGRPGGTIHHILANAPEKTGRRDHWLVVNLSDGCHNGRSDSVHGLGSEAAFKRVHGVDLVAIAIRNREWWRPKTDSV